MIVVRLSGGLGNQLFQYAAGRALSSHHAAELALDTGWFGERYLQTTSRPYALFRYPHKARMLDPCELPTRALYTNALFKRLPLGPMRGPLRLVRESHPGFDPSFLALPDDVYLDGYWQSPRYFDAIAVALCGELTPSVATSDDDRRVLAATASTESVAVHVRRGDYVSVRAAANAHGALSTDYYRAATRAILERLHAPHFFVFSDDPQWTREHFRIEGPTEHVTHNGAGEAFQDLRLMSSCRHQIIANSSLSWWGAWLNPNPEKIVVAPRPWFNTGDPADLIPERWLRIARHAPAAFKS